jgi:hypothetical protein
MSLVRPTHVPVQQWEFATNPNPDPFVVIMNNEFRVICDGKVGPYVNFPAKDPLDTSGLTVIARGKKVNLPWTEIAGFCPQLPEAKIPSIRSLIDNQLRPKFPAAEHWIDTYIGQTKSIARALSEFPEYNLNKAFSRDVLENSFMVQELRPEKLPLTKMGLPEFADFEAMPINAITYKDTFFVTKGALTPSLAFHEMVHVVQWDELGPENFLLAYGIGLKTWGYFACPLEAMAYNLETLYNTNNLPVDTEAFIREQSKLIFAKPVDHPATCLNV